MPNYNYDRAATYYDQTRAYARGVEVQAVAAIADALQLKAGARLLEIGVGTGRIAVPLVRAQGYRYHGQDISTGMMNLLRSKLALPQPLPQGEGSHTVSLTQSDAAALPYRVRSFDAVLAVHVMHLLPEPEQTLHEVRRVLQPGGRFVSVRDNLSAGEDMGARLEQQMAMFLAKEGYVANTKHMAKGNVDEETLTAAGATDVQTSIAFAWTTQATPRDAFAFIAGRQSRGLWDVPDDIFQRALLRLGGWLRDEYPAGFDEAQPQTRNFQITTAFF